MEQAPKIHVPTGLQVQLGPRVGERFGNLEVTIDGGVHERGHAVHRLSEQLDPVRDQLAGGRRVPSPSCRLEEGVLGLAARPFAVNLQVRALG